MDRVLVTGGTGFIGTYVVRRLLRDRDGYRLRLFVRRPERIPAVARELVEVVEGTVEDRSSIRRALEGVHTVLHLAALARAWSARPDAFQHTNVSGLEALLEEARRAGVARLVHVSSLIAAGPARACENAHSGAPAGSPYEQSKRDGEALVLEYAASGRHATIVRPARVYGPGPLHDANGVTKMLSLYLAGRFRVRLADRDVLANYVHADDVAQGIVLAARHGAPGAAYTIGGAENISLRGFLELASSIAGIRRRTVAIPPWAGYAVAGAMELSARFGGAPFLTRAWIRTFLADWRADIGPARRDLGYEPRTLCDGLTETIAWLGALDPQAPGVERAA